MSHTKERAILIVPIGLIAALLLLPLLDRRINTDDHQPERQKSASIKKGSGFLEYDMLPESLKKGMTRLQQQNSSQESHYYFIYYFKNDDVNYRYFIKDTPDSLLMHMPVHATEVLDLIEEKLGQDHGNGIAYDYDPRLNSPDGAYDPQILYKGMISYIMPNDKTSADYSTLRVGILKSASHQWSSTETSGVYALSEVDTSPVPVGGFAYFKKVVTDEVKKQASFLFNSQEGEVRIAFTIGPAAKSPQIIQGFSTDSEDHEAYRMDGAIIRAINESKVRWTPATKNGQSVPVRFAMTLVFQKENNQMLLSMSQLQEASKNW